MINFDGLLIGIVTFLIIGLFHPVVVKAEYYWGDEMLVDIPCLGDLGVIASLFIDSVFVSAICGVFAFFIVLDDQGDFSSRRSVCRKVGSLEIRKENTLGTIVR